MQNTKLEKLTKEVHEKMQRLGTRRASGCIEDHFSFWERDAI